MGSSQLHSVMSTVSRDPTQHSSLQEKIEEQSTAYYSTARLWDDGIIRPTDTRNTVGLALGLAYKSGACGRSSGMSAGGSDPLRWDGSGKGFGVFRM